MPKYSELIGRLTELADNAPIGNDARFEVREAAEAIQSLMVENKLMREALKHWDRQATSWLGSREEHARPGWMRPAIDKARTLLGDSHDR